MQSTKAIFEILFPAEVCRRCQCSQDFTLVSNHSSAVTCPVTTMTHLTVLSGTHPTSTVGVTRYVFLYIIAIKCCCSSSLQLTLTVRFYFDVSAVQSTFPATASQTAWGCFCQNPASCGTHFSLSRRDSQQRERLCLKIELSSWRCDLVTCL